MITIPEYVYKDDAVEFVCPALELSHDEAARMRAALTRPDWPGVLRSEEYICHAFKRLGVNTTAVSNALELMYDCISLYGCLEKELPGYENLGKRLRVANLIRPLWCHHMRAQLKYIIAQG